MTQWRDPPNLEKCLAKWPSNAELVRAFHSHLRQAVAQCVARNTQQTRGLTLVAIGAAESFADDGLFIVVETHAIGEEMLGLRSAGAGIALLPPR